MGDVDSAAAVEVAGEMLWLHPDRAVIWPRGGAVIVADTHFGKSGVFGRHGLAVPSGTDHEDRARLSRLLRMFELRRLIVLGDFLHSPLDPSSQEAADLERWISSLRGITIQVIAGNHDRGVSSGWRGSIEWVSGHLIEAPFRLVHDGAAGGAVAEPLFSLSGHVHPVIALRGLRKRTARVPVFWLRQRSLVLPAFGLFTGGYAIDPAPGERVFAVSPERVIAFPMRQGAGSGT